MVKESYHMGTNYLIDIMAGKWKPSIICALGIQTMRYGELLDYEQKANHTQIAKKVLTEQLNQLIENGIVIKHSFGTVPPKVVYSLSPEGQTLCTNLLALNQVGDDLAERMGNVRIECSADEVRALHNQPVISESLAESSSR